MEQEKCLILKMFCILQRCCSEIRCWVGEESEVKKNELEMRTEKKHTPHSHTHTPPILG
jgi:hypothetical protein